MKNMVEKTYYVFKKYINHHRRTVRNRGIKDVTGECSEGMKECGFGDQKKRVSLLESSVKFCPMDVWKAELSAYIAKEISRQSDKSADGFILLFIVKCERKEIN